MTTKKPKPGGSAKRSRKRTASEPFIVRTSVDAGRLNEELAKAERAFVEHGDQMAALSGAMLALEHGVPLPRRIAFWLRYGILYYATGKRESIDAGLGLNAVGRANPRRRHAEAVAMRIALSRMFFLRGLGASVPQAAALVATLSKEFSASTLAYECRRSGHLAGVADLRALARRDTVDLESTLAEYRDYPLEAAQAKAAIRAMYAKRRS